MTLNEYQEAAIETAVYPEAGKGSLTGLSYCALGLGEVGELQGEVKKILRGDFIDADDSAIKNHRVKMEKELGDVLWYVASLAHELGRPLEYIANLNIKKLKDRQLRRVLKGSGDDR